MTLNLAPQVEAKLIAVAKQKGLGLEALIEQFVEDYQPKIATEHNDAINLLRSWRAEDATDDEAELLRRDAETDRLLNNLQAGRTTFRDSRR